MRKGKSAAGKIDKRLLILVLVLTIIGLILVADASAPQALNFFSDQLYFFKQQGVWAIFGVILMFIAIFIKYSFWERIATPVFFISLALLAIVLIPQVGVSLLGARRWIVIGPMSFQPSEVVKLTLAIYLAKVADKSKGTLSYFIPVGLTAGLIMLQPDLGTTLVVAAVAFLQMFVSGINIFYFLTAGGVTVILAFILTVTSEYRKSRLATFLNATQDPLGGSYHIKQILLALGSGGLLGVGLGNSRQKYLFLPESATDSIFAVVGEELGFLGSVVLIAMFGYLVYRGIKIAERAPDKFSQVLAIGISGWLGSQVFLNIASISALVPLTGIPLPFISYGGTSLVAVLFATGILLNISRYAK